MTWVIKVLVSRSNHGGLELEISDGVLILTGNVIVPNCGSNAQQI
jgi:hypothetical protein